MQKLTLAALLAATILSGAAAAAPASLLGLMSGQWSGGGTVRPNYKDPLRQVTCRITGDTTDTAAKLAGQPSSSRGNSAPI